jgi:D-alanyl-lipoteichoic acid acyltransferase DltB (MBOAT superfamily)
MLFPTFEFAIFFAVVVILVTPLTRHNELRKLILVAVSYFFYMQWNWRFCFLLAFSSLWSYAGGILLARTTCLARRWILGVAVSVHLLVLATFKYFDFFVESVNRAEHHLGLQYDLPFVEIVLPVGISFFTFHGISYLVDVYRGDVPVCRRPTDILLYLAFFPQLVAGPIVRASYFLPQISRPILAPIAVGPPLLLIAGGLFKKVVIANYLATDIVDPVFFDPLRYPSLDLLFGAYGYALQIYCDFSAYSDIAIGLAGLLGYWFPPNFNQPYRAESLQDFWRRWHISLSSWLRDYLYKPLGGSRGSRWFTARNLMITMLLGGIWHGAAWKFLAWGALHGAALTIERGLAISQRRQSRVTRVLAIVFTFHFVCFAWIFFRADNFDLVLIYLRGLIELRPGITQLSPFTVLLICLGLATQFVSSDTTRKVAYATTALPAWLLGLLFGFGVVAIKAMGPDGIAPFIYFQF